MKFHNLTYQNPNLMTSKLLLRIASIYMFIRLILQIVADVINLRNQNKTDTFPDPNNDYLWQPPAHGFPDFFYWGFCIVFALLGRVLWVISDSKEVIARATVEGAFWFLFAFGIEEVVYHYYYSGTATIICSLIVGLSYFKMKGLSIKFTFNNNS